MTLDLLIARQFLLLDILTQRQFTQAHLALAFQFHPRQQMRARRLAVRTLLGQQLLQRVNLVLAQRVRAIHLSHHNPAPELLYLRLRDLGARAVPDGTPIIAGGPSSSLSL